MFYQSCMPGFNHYVLDGAVSVVMVQSSQCHAHKQYTSQGTSKHGSGQMPMQQSILGHTESLSHCSVMQSGIAVRQAVPSSRGPWLYGSCLASSPAPPSHAMRLHAPCWPPRLHHTTAHRRILYDVNRKRKVYAVRRFSHAMRHG